VSLNPVAWDTCILIDAIQKTPDRFDAIAPMLNLARIGDLKIVLSTVCVAECHYLKELAAQGADQEEQNNLIEKWLEHSFLVKRAADMGTCKVAAQVLRLVRGKLSSSDAIIVATALRHKASALITYDDTKGKSLIAQDGKIPDGRGGFLRICGPEGWSNDSSPQLFR
jgi:predicted nucleic acid-binding protein